MYNVGIGNFFGLGAELDIHPPPPPPPTAMPHKAWDRSRVSLKMHASELEIFCIFTFKFCTL